MKQKIILMLKILIILSIALLIILIFCHKSELTSLDLGRHIKNGQMVWQDKNVLYNNLYSFTEPDFSFVNHHWFSGVIFYWLYLLGGFNILTVFSVIITLLTVSLSFYHAHKKSNFLIVSILILPAILLLSQRTDIRPEIFSYFFLVLTFYLIDKFRKNHNYNNLIWLIPIFLVWVNLHIYFFLGLFLITLLLFEQIIKYLIKKGTLASLKKLLYITIASFLISLVNPHFLKGLIYPFNILKKYGYEIVENKSPLYLENLMINYNITIFKVMVSVLIISYLIKFIFIFEKYKSLPGFFSNINIFYLGITVFFTFSAFFAIRNLPLFALMTLPIIASNFYSIKLVKKIKFNSSFKLVGIAIISIIYISINWWLILDLKSEGKYLINSFGLGLTRGTESSFNFYTNKNLSGPIFNNYDLGSALSFWLYPEEKIFVDNRPEAYSVEFFQTIYKPMQQDDEKWNEFSEKYNINLIYFSHTDGTPWAKNFISKRLNDENWPLIYFDYYVVIAIKNNEKNQLLIKQYGFDEKKFIARFEELKNLAIDSSITGVNRTLINLADLAIAYGKKDKANEIYDYIIAKQPNNGQVLALKGYFYSSSQKRSEIIKSFIYFNKAIDNGYKLPAIYNQMGLNYCALEDYKEAKKMWQKAIKIEGNNGHAKYYLNQAEEIGI
ncbi:MAG: hypothetical protein ABIE43_05465 [Patescibacteria group bacterium]